MLLDSCTKTVSIKGGLDLSKEVLWVSVGSGAAELQVVKVGGKKNSADRTVLNPNQQNFFSNFQVR